MDSSGDSPGDLLTSTALPNRCAEKVSIDQPEDCPYIAHMSVNNISLNSQAYQVLTRMKKKGQSYSEVILEHLRPVPETCGELLEELERDFEGVPITSLDRLANLHAGRGRRSKRMK